MGEAPGLPASLQTRYRPLKQLGKGAFGRVFLAEDTRLGRPVAIKLLIHSDREAAHRFAREAEITARLSHPHVVRVFDSGSADEGTGFIVYEYVEGRSLDRILAAGEEIPAERVLAWGAQLASALAAAHELGLLHRDVKPANIIVRTAGSAVLCDFGLARDSRPDRTATVTGRIMGTPAYLAPELWRLGKASPASDQWALAATIYEALYGTRPTDPELLATLSERDLAAAAPRVPPTQRGRHPGLDETLERSLALRPEARFPSCAEFALGLETIAGRGPPGPGLVPPSRSRPSQPEAIGAHPAQAPAAREAPITSRAALATALVAVALGGALLASRPPGAPGVPGAEGVAGPLPTPGGLDRSAFEDAEAAAWRSLEAALEGHRSRASDRLGLEHVGSVLEVVLDARFERTVDRGLLDLAALLRRAADAGPEAAFGDRLLAPARHLAFDARDLGRLGMSPLAVVEGVRTGLGARDLMARLVELHDRLAARFGRLLVEVRPALPALPPEGILLLSHLAAGSERPEAAPVLREILRRRPEGCHPTRDQALLTAELTLLAPFWEVGYEPPCELRGLAVGRIPAEPSWAGSLAAADAASFRGQRLGSLYGLVSRCPDQAGRGVLPQLLSDLAWFEGHAGHVAWPWLPDGLLADWEHLFAADPMRFGAAPPDLGPRIRALADRRAGRQPPTLPAASR